MKTLISLVLLISISACATKNLQPVSEKGPAIKPETVSWFDSSRKREVPVALYYSAKKIKKQEIVIISHGYNENRPGSYLGYSFLADTLASMGYFVASIQHELPSDELIPNTGNLFETRKPFWERGAQNILFVINQLKVKYPVLNFNRITLIGHSNGGDMSALFAHTYPNMLYRLITLDNRRMPLPRTTTPKICTLRSVDFPADAGVLPTSEEVEKFGIKIIQTSVPHSSMSDSGNDAQQTEMKKYVLDFLKE